jgi:hypothetical protein
MPHRISVLAILRTATSLVVAVSRLGCGPPTLQLDIPDLARSWLLAGLAHSSRQLPKQRGDN